MLTITTWLWGDAYTERDVAKLHAGVKRHLSQKFRFAVNSDRPTSFETWPIEDEDKIYLEFKGCFARLRMFDPWWQDEHGIDDRLVCIDLDSVVTGPLDPLFDRPEPFVILQGANASNPCPYNGSLMMLRRHQHPEVWLRFTRDAIDDIPFFEFPDDQGWLHKMLPNAAGWQAGSESGVYAFCKPGWPKTGAASRLPHDARLVVFPGHRNPYRYRHLPWIEQHWRT